MTIIAYCGDRTCCFNNNGKCGNKKIGISQQGVCMGYSPIVVPTAPSTVDSDKQDDNNEKNPIGFMG